MFDYVIDCFIAVIVGMQYLGLFAFLYWLVEQEGREEEQKIDKLLKIVYNKDKIKERKGEQNDRV